jgi:serum/glucocorticoid-regulated kinase 2
MYCAPEMLEENNQAGLFTDLWALGCIMYEMASGQQMFRGKNNALVYDKIQKYDVDFSLIKDADLRDLIIKLTDVDPQKRIGLQSINEIKNHRFFNGFNFDLIQKQQLECPPLDCNLEDLCDDTADNKIARIEK